MLVTTPRYQRLYIEPPTSDALDQGRGVLFVGEMMKIEYSEL